MNSWDLDNERTYSRFILTLEFWYIPVVVGIVLPWRTMIIGWIRASSRSLRTSPLIGLAIQQIAQVFG